MFMEPPLERTFYSAVVRPVLMYVGYFVHRADVSREVYVTFRPECNALHFECVIRLLISLSNSVRTKNAIHTNVLVNLCA